jgi:hypothetical protein
MKMKNLLVTVATLATIVAMTPTAEAQVSNAKEGCLVLQMAIATRIENMMADPSDWCGQIKQEATDENWFMCLAPAIITYNRLRGLPDNERAPFHVREAITKGCIMIIFNVNEAKAAAVAKRNVEK